MEKQTTTAKSKITRRNYSRISGSLELPNLVEIQTNSYKWFKEVGIKEVLMISTQLQTSMKLYH